MSSKFISNSLPDAVHTASLDGVGTGHLTELLVHVVGSRTRVIAKPDAKVLHLEGLLLGDLGEGDNLTSRALDLFQLAEKVPEARFGDDFIAGKDAHLVELRGGLLGGGELAADDLVLVNHPED